MVTGSKVLNLKGIQFIGPLYHRPKLIIRGTKSTRVHNSSTG